MYNYQRVECGAVPHGFRTHLLKSFAVFIQIHKHDIFHLQSNPQTNASHYTQTLGNMVGQVILQKVTIA